MGDIAYLFAYVKLFGGLRCQVFFLAYSVPNCSSKVFSSIFFMLCMVRLSIC